ncbi:MAG: cadA [Hyphomicrobiales bacterium]|nr:cadA [Hyphomicrobiales bacterium]
MQAAVETVDLSLYVRPAEDGTSRMDLAIDGVDCAACLDDIEGAMKACAGVVSARLNLTTHRLAVVWRQEDIDASSLIAALARAGYRAYPFEQSRVEADEQRRSLWLLKCLAVAGFAAMNIMLLSVAVWSGNVSDITPETRDFFHWLSALIALPAAAYAGQPFFRSAIAGLRAGKLNMDFPISLGICLALSMSVVETMLHGLEAYFDSAVMLLLFLLAGRYLDQTMRRRTRAAAGNLAALKGEIAHRLSDEGAVVAVPVAALMPGNRILVRPGDRVPADGRVLSGTSEVDTSIVTGETMRSKVTAGARVYAGTINFDGALTVEVTAAGEGTLLDDVARLIEKAGAARSRYMRLADRAARVYAPVVHAAAASTLVFWLIAGASVHDSIIIAISVLIITCPCALALAVPAVQVVASGHLFRAGVYLNAPDALERLAEIDTVVFDKTGTLTLPEPHVSNAGTLPPDLLAAGARLAASSRHPLAMAVARTAPDLMPYDDAEEVPGAGVRAMVDGVEMRLGSATFCASDDCTQPSASDVSLIHLRHGSRRARIEIRQSLRPDARQTLDRLRAMGFDLHILSGDRPEAVLPLASILGVSDARGGLDPAGKIAAIEALRAQGRKVLMVGDGLNDAPALAAAHASLSPITAVDLAQAQADAAFLGERLAPVAQSLDVARQARALMRQNLGIAIVYNLFAVPLAVAGLVTPLIAAAAMSGSSIIVTVNALRMRGVPKTAAAQNPSRKSRARLALATKEHSS